MHHLTLNDQKKLAIAHNPFKSEEALDFAFVTAANKHLQWARDYVLQNPNSPANWFEIQGRIEIEVQDLRNQICRQSAYLSLKELEDLSFKVFVLGVLAKRMLTISNSLVA